VRCADGVSDCVAIEGERFSLVGVSLPRNALEHFRKPRHERIDQPREAARASVAPNGYVSIEMSKPSFGTNLGCDAETLEPSDAKHQWLGEMAVDACLE
jgi:hypothetical protein